MTFEQLLARLLAELVRRIENGQLTERGLARLARLSQPHVHHILKGKRGMTPQVADRFLEVLGIEADHLVEESPVWGAARGPAPEPERCVLLPLLEGLVGPSYPPPALLPAGLYFPFPASLLGLLPADFGNALHAGRYAMVRLGADPLLQDVADENDLLVISKDQGGPEAAPMAGSAAIWAFRDSWVFDGGEPAWITETEVANERKRRAAVLRAEGERVALVHWLVRRLRATALPDGAWKPGRGSR